MAIDPLATLTPPDRAALEGRLVAFDLGWTPGRLDTAVRELPNDGPVRLSALIEFAKIDLERRWQAGQTALVEHYLADFPELRPAVGELVRAEIEARRAVGAVADPSDFNRRFPEVFASDAAPTLPFPNQTPTDRPPATDMQFTRFGRYEIISRLGQGGMGTVYLARDTELDRRVALKIPLFRLDDTEAMERFALEARAAATVEHPNVCPVYDVGRHEGKPYLTMAYIEGQTLADLVRAGPVPPRRAVELVCSIADAVAEAHRRGVVHRDLKPGNILVTRAGEPMVTDFGLAHRAADGDHRLTQAGTAIGTPLYMSPEQATGDTARIGPASDVYSLGVVLYELLVGRPPFDGSRTDLFAQVLTSSPPTPSTLRPEIDPRLDEIVATALAKRPENRFENMTAFADELVSWIQRAERPPSRWLGWLIGIGATVLLLGSVALVGQGRSWFKAAPEPEPGPIVPSTPQPKFLFERSVDEELVAIGFDENGTVQAGLVADGNRLTIRRWADDEVPLARKPQTRQWVVFAPDGRRCIVGGGSNQYTEVQRVDTGETLQKFDTGPHAHCGAWSGDGKRVLIGMNLFPAGQRARAYEIKSGQAVGEYAGHESDIRCVALSDDGEAAYSVDATRHTVWKVKGGERAIEAGDNTIRSCTYLAGRPAVAFGYGTGEIVVTGSWQIFEFQNGHTDSVTALKVAGKLLVSGSSDRSVRGWEAETGKTRWEIPNLPAPVKCVAISADGQRVAIGMAKAWQVWSVPAGE